MNYHNTNLLGDLGMLSIKKLYNNNSIFQFWTSYLLVLIIPLFIVFICFQYVFRVVEDDANKTNNTMLEHSINLVDSELKSMESLALQAAQSNKLLEFSKATKLDSKNALLALEAMNDIFSLINFHGDNVVDQAYIYCSNSNYIMYENTLYKLGNFEKYITKWGFDLEDWYDRCINNTDRLPFYLASNNNSLIYVLPFSNYLKGENQGVIVLQLDTKKLEYLLDFSNKFEEYAVFVLNANQKLFWTTQNDNSFTSEDDTNNFLLNDNNIDATALSGANVEDIPPEVSIDRNNYSVNSDSMNNNSTNSFYTGDDLKDSSNDLTLEQMTLSIKNKDTQVIQFKSAKNGWQYYVIVPENEVYKELNFLKVFIFSLLIIAVVIGETFSLFLSIRAGRPINDIFRRLDQKENSPRNSEKLGELVSDIIKSNQRYIEDLEKDKPLLQKAFFHDLIKSEFVNAAEIKYMAEKAGLSITSQNYTIVALKVFANNDFYEVDKQTIEDVRILMQVVTSRLEELSKSQIWFYKKDYLTTLAVFLGNQSTEEINTLVEQVFYLVTNSYSVETRWGISSNSNDLLNVWKVCEEAITALENCDSSNHIVQYHSRLDNIKECYFPDMAKESLKNCIQYGDVTRMYNVLNIIQIENFEKRNLSRKRFLKLNSQIVSMLSEFCDSIPEVQDQIIVLNQIVIDYEEGMQEKYFAQLNTICEFLCQESTKKIHLQRSKLVKNIRNYINENYMDSNLGLAKISSVFGISEGYISTIFKEQDGINFADYVEQLRIEKACHLLTENLYKIADISDMVGYNSVQSFRRAFKRVLGINPTEYRLDQET